MLRETIHKVGTRLITDRSSLHWMAQSKENSAGVTSPFLVVQNYKCYEEHRSGLSMEMLKNCHVSSICWQNMHLSTGLSRGGRVCEAVASRIVDQT